MKEIRNGCSIKHQQNYSTTTASSSFQGPIPQPPAPTSFALANRINHTAPWKFSPLPNNLVIKAMNSPEKPQPETKPDVEPGFEYSISVEPSSDPKGEL